MGCCAPQEGAGVLGWKGEREYFLGNSRMRGPEGALGFFFFLAELGKVDKARFFAARNKE